ncbi:hypothetical protein AAG570_005216 [Ranatra chinensis]|uniref:Uncharacterized protein n=1 Tax=Ranatra chinensis TaxID=642074 RepID=A0ABD0YLL3_9HEMI
MGIKFPKTTYATNSEHDQEVDNDLDGSDSSTDLHGVIGEYTNKALETAESPDGPRMGNLEGIHTEGRGKKEHLSSNRRRNKWTTFKPVTSPTDITAPSKTKPIKINSNEEGGFNSDNQAVGSRLMVGTNRRHKAAKNNMGLAVVPTIVPKKTSKKTIRGQGKDLEGPKYENEIVPHLYHSQNFNPEENTDYASEIRASVGYMHQPVQLK